MKIKHVPIKSLMVRCRKKGKTRGRPSKFEMSASKLLSYEMWKKSNVLAMHKAIHDLLVYGTSCVQIKP